ncbi:MAG: hypothetical protein ACFFC7_14745, partial [Candidatus Hermodarchaeota archaeon]
ALKSYEMENQLKPALKVYQEVENKILALEEITSEHEAYSEQQRVLAYTLMRQANILRQLGKTNEASEVSKREITAARASGDDVTLARSLMSFGTTCAASGEVKSGLEYIEEAQTIFSKGTSYDHKQGLGWCWILKADLINAGILSKEQEDVIKVTTQAIELLKSIGNWPGVTRAYEARAKAYEQLGNETAASADLEAATVYRKMVTVNNG